MLTCLQVDYDCTNLSRHRLSSSASSHSMVTFDSGSRWGSCLLHVFVHFPGSVPGECSSHGGSLECTRASGNTRCLQGPWVWLPPTFHQPYPTSVGEMYSTCSSGKDSRVTRQRAWKKSVRNWGVIISSIRVTFPKSQFLQPENELTGPEESLLKLKQWFKDCPGLWGQKSLCL